MRRRRRYRPPKLRQGDRDRRWEGRRPIGTDELDQRRLRIEKVIKLVGFKEKQVSRFKDTKKENMSESVVCSLTRRDNNRSKNTKVVLYTHS